MTIQELIEMLQKQATGDEVTVVVQDLHADANGDVLEITGMEMIYGKPRIIVRYHRDEGVWEN